MKYKIGKRTFFIEALTPIATVLDLFNSNDSLTKDQILILTSMQGFVVDRILKQLCNLPQTNKNEQLTKKEEGQSNNNVIQNKKKKKEEKFSILKSDAGAVFSLNEQFEKNKSSRVFYL